MVDYSKSFIYKLSSYDNDLIYIGSTTQILCKRLYQHRKKNNKCSSKILFEESNNVFITLLEEVTAANKQELHAIERKYIENFDCVNKFIPTRTDKEYRQDNKELLIEKRRIYNQNNKKMISERTRIYQQKNKKMISEKQQIYYQQNKEMVAERTRIYQQNNKEKKRQYEYWRCNPQLFDTIKPLFYDM